MKKLSLLLTLLMLLGCASVAQATMMYYSMEGLVIHLDGPPALYPPMGSSVDAVFGVDFNRLGEWHDPATGIVHQMSGTYYTTLIGSSVLGWVDAGQRPDMNSYWAQGGQEDPSAGFGSFTEFHHGMEVIVRYTLGQLEIGDSLLGVFIDHANNSFAGASLTITAISSTNPYAASATPIPAAVWLLGSGLAGIMGWRRKQRG